MWAVSPVAMNKYLQKCQSSFEIMDMREYPPSSQDIVRVSFLLS